MASLPFELAPAVWLNRSLIQVAGTAIYLVHLSMPALVAVEAAHGRRFESPELLRASIDRTAWVMIAGMGCLPEHPEGAADPVIAARLSHVGAMHRTWAMPAWAMPFIASVMTAAPAWMQGHTYPGDASLYHQRAATIAAAMGTRLPQPAKLDGWVRSMIARHGGHTEYAYHAVRTFASVYRSCITAAIAHPCLPNVVRELVLGALEA